MSEPVYRIYNCECEYGIPKLPDNSLDLVVTSPGYNVDLGNNKYKKEGYDIYKDNMEHKVFIEWLTTVFGMVYAKLKPGGRLCLNIGDGQNGRVPTHADLIYALCHRNGYLLHTYAIWDKANTSNRAAWGSYLSPSSPSFPFGFEYVLVFSKGTRKLQTQGETDITKDEFIAWTNPIWRFQPEVNMQKYGHPSVFPEELPMRCIKMFSWTNAVVMDPFGGVHTTGVACKKTGRSYIGFEMSPQYCETGLQRINETVRMAPVVAEETQQPEG